MRAAAIHDPTILVKVGLTADFAAPLCTPDGREFWRWPPSFIRPEHMRVLSLVERLGEVAPLSGAIAGWPAWFAAAWLEVRGLIALRKLEVARG